MKKIFTHLLAVLMLSLLTTSAWAQVEAGKVYRFINKTGTNIAMMATTADGEVSLTEVYGKTKVDDTSADGYLSQLWLVQSVDVEGESYYQLRNLETGRYLVGNTKSQAWSMTNLDKLDKTKFELYSNSDGYVSFRSIIHKEGDIADYCYMHYGVQNEYKIVGWLTSGDATLWTAENVDMATADIETALNNALTKYPTGATYENALSQIFEDYDGACLTLKSAYQSMNDDALAEDTYYASLPEPLQKMVKKVRDSNWEEKTVDPDSRPNGNNNTNHSLWTVSDTWESAYAKKFRVQMYEPYSIEGEITTFLRFNAHCNMDNPTGIYANAGDYIYIMVDGEIPEGAELWVAHQVGHGATYYYNNAAYTQLQKGLNVVEYTNDGSQLWINYVVHTYNSETGTFPNKLSDFAPLKIHIEGGYINGFFNAMGDYRASAADGADNLWGDVDNDEDWNYYKQRAALSGDFVLLGHRQTLLFDFGTWDADKGCFGVANADGGIEYALAYWLENIQVPDTTNCYGGEGNTFGDYSDTYYPGMNLDASTGKINIMLEAWDRIMYSEHATMGLLGKTEIDWMNKLYPGWTAENTTFDIYNYGSKDTGETYKAFCEGRDYSDYYNHHGAAVGAGSGYMSGGWRVCNYHYNTMGSIIGKIAYEAGPTWGPAHEIGHQHQGVFNLNGQTEVTNNFFSNVAVWYMGMGTSRYNGSEGNLEHVLDAFNTEDGDAYTNNIWALTHMYYRLWLYYHLAGNNTQFWPRLYELCRQVPLGNGTSIDGETSFLRFYQHACDAAGEDLTEFFRAHGYLTPMEDRLVGDYTSATYNMTQAQVDAAIEAVKAKNYPVNYAVLLINDGTSETTVKHDGATARALWDSSASAELGSVNDFIDGETSVTGDYTATVSADGTVTMTGEGGIGFLVFNDEGELVSFSNKTTFELSDEAAYLVATGQATISVANGTNTIVKAEVDLTAIQSSLISSLINDVDEILKYVDDTYTKVGYYKASAVKDLQAALATAKETLETGEGIAAAYEILYTEYRKVMDNDDAKVAIISGAKYAIKSKSGSDYMDVDDSGNVTTTNSSTFPTEDSDLWIIEVVSADTYNIKNASTGKYLQQVSDSNSVNFTVGDNAVNYKITNVDNVLYAFSTTSYSNRYMDRHSATQVATWGTGISNNAKWWITLADDDVAALSVSTAELQALIEKTENLVGTLATVDVATGSEITLSTSSSDNYYITCSNNDTSEGDGVAALLDNDPETYLHTNYHSLSSDYDYLQVQIAEGNELNLFQIKGVQRNGGQSDFPSIINVQGSTDGTSWEAISTITNLPQDKGSSWESGFITVVKSYPYLRFVVKTGTNKNYSNPATRPYFHMAEFSIYNVDVTATLLSAYAEYSAILETSLISDAHNGVELGKAWLNYDAATSAEIKAYTETLQEKYDALYAAYKQVIDSEKAKLQSIIDDTEGLITQVGTATVIADADIDLLGKLYAERVYDADTGSSDYSTAEAGYNLLDGDVDTHFHSDYIFSTMVSPPYIRVDLGDGNTASKFEFNYTTRNQTGCAPTTLNVYGSNEQDDNYTLIKTFTSGDSDNPLPTAAKTSWTSSEVTSATAYRYFKFEVAVSQGSKTESSVKKYYFAISEFGFRKFGEVSATINQEYESMVSESLLIDTRRTVNASETMVGYATDYVVTVEQLKAQTAAQQAAYDELYAAMTAVDKTALEELVALAQPLYDQMTDGNGNMNADYVTSSLTADQLTAASDALAAANEALLNATSQGALDTAEGTLQDAYDALLLVEATNKKSTLETTGLEELINNVKTLLGTIATEAVSNKVALPLTTTSGANYYISVAGTSSGSVDYLIDKNADGTGITAGDSYYGSNWGSSIAAFSQYVQVDLGTGVALDELSFDYTTRDSNHATERPTLIKIQGSNDGTTFVDIAEVSDGMPVGRCEQWVMANVQELAARYRYIRFAVKGGTETTTVDDVTTTTDINSFHMSDFNVYAYIDYALKDYYTTATGLGFVDLCVALQSAEDLLARTYFTEEQYDEVLAKLQACYGTTSDVVAADYTTRTDLETLITSTQDLVDEVATVTEVAAVTLNTTEGTPGYIYCNADNSTNESADATDKLGVAALLDGNLSTHLHTTYGNNVQDDDLDHYIRVDMGENNAVAIFEFSYSGRQNNTNNAPTAITVQGYNSTNGEWADIVSLTDMTIVAGQTATYKSPLIEMSEAYRYVRLMVTATYGENGAGGGTNTPSGGTAHPFFVMSEFGFTAHHAVEVKDGYTNVTKELVRAAVDEKNTATAEKAYYMSESDYNTALGELQADYDALKVASLNLPVIITTDASKPVLYKIKIKSNEHVFTYEGKESTSSKKPVLAADELGNRYQAWYFMQGTNDESYEDVLIMPYYNEGAKNTTSMLGYANINEGTEPVASETGASSYNWYITFTSEGSSVTTEGWWNLQPEGGDADGVNAFINQYGGSGATKLAFWRSSDNPNNTGSQFQFILDETDYSLSDAYYALYNLHARCGGTLTGGTAIGDYTEESVAEYNAEYDNASALLQAKASTDEEYTTAHDDLNESYAAIEYVMPEEGKLYMIRSISTKTYCSGKYVHALCDTRTSNSTQNHKHLVFDAIGDISQLPLAVFTFEDVNANGECKMRNLHTGMYVKSFTKNAEHMTADAASAATVKIGNFAPGQAILSIGTDAPMHAQEDNAVIVHWGAEAGGASLWSIDEVTDISQVVHNVTMTAKFSSVMLGYNATVPAGVEAYNAVGIADGYVTLEMIADGDDANNNVIPANTPVVLYRSDDVTTKVFNYTTATATVTEEQLESSVLGGSLYTKYVECDDAMNYYKLMLKNGEAKMYWMYKEFNAEGESQGDTHAGGHIKCSANKIYMALDAQQNAVSYGMRFIDDSATGIEEVNGENEKVKTIYDLQGRKLSEITQPGIYIVDGKRVYVK